MSTRPARPVLATIAFAFFAALALPVPSEAAAPFDHIANDTVWQDTSNNEIKAQGGNVLKVGSTFYWVGTKMDPSGTGPLLAKSVNLYTSSDLENWTFVKALVTQAGTTGDLAVGNWLGRPQLAHNPATGDFVLTVEVPGGRMNTAEESLGNGVGFFSSPTVDGTYAYAGKQLPSGLTRGDGSIFVEGASAYLVYVGDGAESRNTTINIAPLSADWMTIQAPIYTQANDNHNEAPAIIKVGDTYYLFASGMNWWAGTPTSYRTSTDLMTWSAWSSVATEPASSTSFGTQFEQIIPILGTSGTSYLYNGDRYSQFSAGPNPAPAGVGRNAWYPVTFTGGVPTLHGATDVDVDVTTGVLSANEVANGRFDQDAPGTVIPQWSATGTAGAVRVEATTGVSNRQLTLWKETAYEAWAGQDVSLPNGSYTLTFDARSSGGQEAAYFAVKNHGSTEVHLDLVQATPHWTTHSLTFTVTTGTVRIGLWSDSPAGRWLNLDNVAIWRN